MALVVPAGRNLVHNPRPANTTHIDAFGGVTAPFVTDRSFSGPGSLFVTIPNGGVFRWNLATAGDADLLTLGSGPLHASVRLSGASGPGITTRLIAFYTDATNSATPMQPIDAASSDFTKNTLPGLALNAAKTISGIMLYLENTSGVTRSVYVGGFDVRLNQVPDAFIHGSAGANYSWEGAENNSPSNRAAFTVSSTQGRGGQLYPSVKVEVVNRQNQFLRDITDHFLDGSITYDLDADTWKGSMTLTLDDPDLIIPFADEFIRPTLRVEYADGSASEEPLGLFTVDPPKESWVSGSNDRWAYQGRDLLAILAQTTLRQTATGGGFVAPTYVEPLTPDPEDPATWSPLMVWNSPDYVAADGYIVVAGQPFSEVIEKLLTDPNVGLSHAQFDLEIPGTVLATAAWENSVSVLQVLTDILKAAGYLPPWVTTTGVIVSAPANLRPQDQPADVVFATGEDSPVRWPFEVEADVSRIGNRVRCTSSFQNTMKVITGHEKAVKAVYGQNVPKKPKGKQKKKLQKWKKKTKKGLWPNTKVVEPAIPAKTTFEAITYWGPVEAWAANMDPLHPLSFPRLGRFIDLPDVNVPLLGSETDAAEIEARRALNEASNIPITARLATEVMVRGLNEVYELNLMNADGEPIASGQGRYWCRGWTLQLGAPWEMIHTLRRIIDYTEVSWGTE